MKRIIFFSIKFLKRFFENLIHKIINDLSCYLRQSRIILSLRLSLPPSPSLRPLHLLSIQLAIADYMNWRFPSKNFHIQTISVNRVSTVSCHAFPQRAPLAGSPASPMREVSRVDEYIIFLAGEVFSYELSNFFFSSSNTGKSSTGANRAEARHRRDTRVATSGHQLSVAPRRDVDATPEDVRGRPTTPPCRRRISIVGSSLQFPADTAAGESRRLSRGSDKKGERCLLLLKIPRWISGSKRTTVPRVKDQRSKKED